MDAVDLINFDGLRNTDDLLKQIGFSRDLEHWLPEHLSTVFHKQHNDAQITSIEFIKAEDISAGGMPNPQDTNLIFVDSWCIPLNFRVILENTRQTAVLDIKVVLKVKGSNGTYDDVNTDILIQNQSII